MLTVRDVTFIVDWPLIKNNQRQNIQNHRRSRRNYYEPLNLMAANIAVICSGQKKKKSVTHLIRN